jgi:hypothetical protein
MKSKLLLLAILISVFAFAANSSYEGGNPETAKVEKVKTITYGPTTFGVEKGTRAGCPSGSGRICCGSRWCLVTPLSKKKKFADDGSDEMDRPALEPAEADKPVTALDYCEAAIYVLDERTLEIYIPFHKILPEVYRNWYVDDIFDAEYFPFTNDVSELFGLRDIAISEGRYPVERNNTGFIIHVNYERQRPE